MPILVLSIVAYRGIYQTGLLEKKSGIVSNLDGILKYPMPSDVFKLVLFFFKRITLRKM